MSNRKAFEQWAKGKGYLLDFLKHRTGGAYLDKRTQSAWEKWDADLYPDKELWEAYELACQRIREFEAALLEVSPLILGANFAASRYPLAHAIATALEPPRD